MSNERKDLLEQERLIRTQEQENALMAQHSSEHAILSHHAADAGDWETRYPSEVPADLVQALDMRVRQTRSQSLYEMICSYMYRITRYRLSDEKVRSLQKKAGKKPLPLEKKLETSRFYKNADISGSVWSDLRKAIGVPSEDTLFKLVLALELNEEDAVCLLRKAGKAFVPGNHKHDLVRRLLETTKNGFDLAAVQEAFEDEQKNCASMEAYVDSLYDDAGMRREKRSRREQELRRKAQEAGRPSGQEDKKRKSVAMSVKEHYGRILSEAQALREDADETSIKRIIKALDYEATRVSQRQADLKDKFNELRDKYADELNETRLKYEQEIKELKAVGKQVSESLLIWKERLAHLS